MIGNHFMTIVIWAMLCIQSISFHLVPRRVMSHFPVSSTPDSIDLTEIPDLPVPTTAKARMRLIVGGNSVTSAVFRAELKKELTFFRVNAVVTTNLNGVCFHSNISLLDGL